MIQGTTRMVGSRAQPAGQSFGNPVDQVLQPGIAGVVVRKDRNRFFGPRV